MKVPAGMQFHGHGHRLFEGDVIPEDLIENLGAGHPLIKAAAKAVVGGEAIVIEPDTEADEK